jgi:cobalt/nickel transport system permease protein
MRALYPNKKQHKGESDMHIPDGYLSPSTCLAMGVGMAPVWAVAVKRVKATLKSRQVPLMAIGAAFSFTIMMYNVPIPDGTTAHAVGGGLLAVVLGPWAATICITIALAIQALLFGDGGIWSFTANCFNMAFLIPFCAYGIYRLIAANSELTATRRWLGAAVGSYVGINAAALAAGTELGIQPLLFHAANGTPLYCPYPLGLSIPAMMLAHLTVAGGLEAVVTAMVVRFLQSYDPGLLEHRSTSAAPAAAGPSGYRKLWYGVAALIILSPLGLLAQGSAWGEWGADEMAKLVGYIPAGLARLSESWSHALLPDYALPGPEHGFWASAAVYILCAAIALGIISLLTYLLGRFQAAEMHIQEKPGEGR